MTINSTNKLSNQSQFPILFQRNRGTMMTSDNGSNSQIREDDYKYAIKLLRKCM